MVDRINESMIAGPGTLRYLANISYPGRPLLVTTPGFKQRGIIKILEDVVPVPFSCFAEALPNPDIVYLKQTCARFRNDQIGIIIALGGGSAIDSAKALACDLAQNHSDFLSSVLADKKSTITHSLPIVAIPTTAGTGSEITPFATIWDSQKKLKLSLCSDLVVPAFTILDPELTVSLPPDLTLYSGLDCITHALESIWNKYHTQASLEHALDALSVANKSLPAVLKNPSDIDARLNMLKASMLAGRAISINRTAIAHSISYPLTAHYHVPHGLAVGFTTLSIIDLVANYDFGIRDKVIKQCLTRTSELLRRLNLVDHVTRYLSYANATDLVPEMFAPGRADNFVLKVNDQLIHDILKSAFNS
jgi:phosphonate metabolism-associated iron-containing alcohol dehydrogenase